MRDLGNNYSLDTQSLLLLALYLGPIDRTQPLTLDEYNKLAGWLAAQGSRPGSLLADDGPNLALSPIPPEKVKKLLARQAALNHQLEAWQEAGISLVARTMEGYPPRLKQVLKKYTPPVLFCLGNTALLEAPAASLVGSRELESGGEAFARQVGREAGLQGRVLVSGGAKGADFAALDACLAAGGRVLVYPALGVARFSLGRGWKAALEERRLVVVGPFLPYAPWSVTNAMERNRLIYAHSPACFVAASQMGQGGTWAGASEALSRHLTHVLARQAPDAPDGNRALLALGAEGVSDAAVAEAMTSAVGEVQQGSRGKGRHRKGA